MAKLEADIRSYADAARFLGDRTLSTGATILGKKTRKLGNNTYVERPDYSTDIIGVRLHATVIVTYHRDGRVILDTGGWNTNTTRDRLHQLTPVGVFVSGRNGDCHGLAADLVVTVGYSERAGASIVVVADSFVTLITDPATGEVLDLVGDRA